MEPAAVDECDAHRAGARPAIASVLITHGLFDLVTPYFGTQLLLDQVPEARHRPPACVCRSIRVATCSTPTTPRARRCATTPRGCSGGADFDRRDRRRLRGGNPWPGGLIPSCPRCCRGSIETRSLTNAQGGWLTALTSTAILSLVPGEPGRLALHRAGQAAAERVRRKLHRPAAR